MKQLSIIVVSYNTCKLTLECLRSVFAETVRTSFELLVVDNASIDDSAAAIAAEFPQVRLITRSDNIGFAAANNLAANDARGEWLLLLNPDTVVLDGAVDKLVAFATHRSDADPRFGIFGGRTLFPDGSLNPTSCWMRPTPWSAFCGGSGLTYCLRKSRVFNPEAMPRWRRDTVREVDIVTGCFFLIRRSLWNELDGFDPAFFMYGEEADLCLRARTTGALPIICPDAAIIHYGGRSETHRARKLVQVLRARRLLMQRHWTSHWIPFGLAVQTLAVLHRLITYRLLTLLRWRAAKAAAAVFTEVWRRRNEWRVDSSALPTIQSANWQAYSQM